MRCVTVVTGEKRFDHKLLSGGRRVCGMQAKLERRWISPVSTAMTQNAKPPTTEQLRRDIDSGRTGDKAPGLDPAAAPLGTDEEAGGAGPTAAEIAQARALERRNARGDNAVDPRKTPQGG